MKNIGYYILIAIIIFLTFLVLKDDGSKAFKKDIKNLERKLDSLKIEGLKIEDSIYFYKELASKEQLKADSLNDKLITLKTKRHEIPHIVSTYTPTELDSLLTAYQHPRGN